MLWQRNFRLLWIGETVNQTGNAMALIGVPLLAVLFLRATPLEVGALAACAYLPWLVIGLPAGAWVDRLEPRRVMVCCDIISAILYGSIPAAYAMNKLTIGQLLVVQLLAGVSSVFFMTAYQVNLPSLVKPEDLVEGNAKIQASYSAASMSGRGLSGIVTQVVGATASTLFNAISFIVSALCLLGIRAPQPETTKPRQAANLRQDIVRGIELVFRDPYLRPMAIFGGLANLALDANAAIVLVFLVRTVGLSPGIVGVLMAIPGISGLLSATIARRIVVRFGNARSLLLAALGGTPFALLIPLTQAGPGVLFYVAGVFMTVMGVTTCTIIMATFCQTYCPRHMIGRATATMRFITMGTSPIGALAGGLLGTWLGLRDALWAALAFLTLSGTVLLTSALTSSRDLPDTISAADTEPRGREPDATV